MYTIWYNIRKKDNLKHARTCMYNINYHIVCSVKYRRKMYEKFPDLRQQLWKGELWNHSYYLETIGDISEETIRKYIEHRSKQYWRKEGPCQRQERKRTVLSRQPLQRVFFCMVGRIKKSLLSYSRCRTRILLWSIVTLSCWKRILTSYFNW